MPNQLVDSNFLIQDRANSVRSLLNAGSRLRLYQSAITPSPSDTLGTYTPFECNFDTYTIKTLTGGWAGVTQIIPGEYQSLSTTQTYGSPATTGNTIFGLFVDDGAGNLLFAMLFDAAITYSVGSPSLMVQIAYQVWAKSLL